MEANSAYHEAGHAVIAVLLGGHVLHATIERNTLDAPGQDGVVSVAWSRTKLSPSEIMQLEVITSLAGPAAEMVYEGETLHPAAIAQWRQDWEHAWMLSAKIEANESRRNKLLEHACVRLVQFFKRDDVWQAVAELADLLEAHESLNGDEIHDVVSRWLEI